MQFIQLVHSVLRGGLASLFIALVLLQPTGIAQAQTAEKPSLRHSPRPVPDINFTNAEGKSVTLSDYKGKVILLNFWASWCAPCVKELPDLDRLQQSLGDTHFKVIALSVDGKGFPNVQQFVDRLGLKHIEVFHDAGSKMFFGLGLYGLPYSVIIDKSGKEAMRLKGLVDWTNSDVNLVLNELLSQTEF